MANSFNVQQGEVALTARDLDNAGETGVIGPDSPGIVNADGLENAALTIQNAATFVSEGPVDNQDDGSGDPGANGGHAIKLTNDNAGPSSVTLKAGSLTRINDPGADAINSERDDFTLTIEGGQITTRALAGSRGVNSSGDRLVLTMSGGQITTGGNTSDGIRSTGADAKITISGGSITTAGDGSHGIVSTGNDAKITISGGSITTAGDGSHGIISAGNDAKITISGGEISTAGDGSHGISSRGNDAKITISGGEISTAGDGSYGILSRGRNFTFTMGGGKITTTGAASHGLGLLLEGDLDNANDLDASPAGKGYEHLLEVGGLINTKGAASHGIYIGNDEGTSRARLDISGSIIVEGVGSVGVLIEDQTGGISQFEISGRIEAKQGADNESKPIAIKKADDVDLALNIDIKKNARIIGNIEMGVAGGGNGDDDDTIKLMDKAQIKGDVNMGAGTDQLNISGNARIIGDINMGAGDNDDTLTLKDSARIKGKVTMGAGADQLNISGNARIIGDIDMGDGDNDDTLTLKDSARIKGKVTMGAGADTLALDGDSIIIGDIDMGDNNDTVKLGAQARVTGVIDGGANEDTLDLTGSMVADRRAADSFSLRYKNFENVKGVPTPSKKNYLVGINFKGQAGYDAAKETRLVHIEPTGQAAETRALSGLNDALHDLGGRRLDGGSGQRYAGRPVQLAAKERIPKHLFQDSRPSAWAEFFGAAQRRGKDGYAKSYALDYRGIAAGLEQDFRGARLGFLLGYASTTFKTRPASIKTDSRSFFAGMYGRHTLDNYLEDAYLQGALNFSYNDHDNRRRIIEAQNIVIAKGEYKSWALSPSLTLGRNFRLNSQFSLEPSVDLRYSVGFYDDYSEKGLQQRQDALSIKERTQQSLLGRLNLAGVYQLPGEAGRVALRFGLSHRRHFASDLKGRVGDKAFTFDNAGSATVNLMQAGLDVAVNVTDALSVNARWEYATNLGGVSDHTNRAQLFAVYRF